MSTVILTIIGVVIFSAVMIGSLSYIDSSNVPTHDDGTYIANRMEMAAEVFLEIENESGTAPSSLTELYSAGLPDPAPARPGTLAISGSNICYAMPYSDQNEKTLRFVTSRIGGSISGNCGNPASEVSNIIVATLPL
jgi:hypothetical protein